MVKYLRVLVAIVFLFSIIPTVSNADTSGNKDSKKKEIINNMIEQYNNGNYSELPKFAHVKNKVINDVADKQLSSSTSNNIPEDANAVLAKVGTDIIDGQVVDEYLILTQSYEEKQASDGNSTNVTQWLLVDYYLNGNDVQFIGSDSWWTRASSTYTVKNAQSTSYCQWRGGMDKDTFKIGTPSWTSNETPIYRNTLSCGYVSQDDGLLISAATVLSDHYKGSTKFRSQIQTTITLTAAGDGDIW